MRPTPCRHVDPEEDLGHRRLRQPDIELNGFRFEDLPQLLFRQQPDGRAVAAAREEDQRGHEPAKAVRPEEHAGPPLHLGAEHFVRQPREIIHIDVEEIVAREGLQYGQDFLAVVGPGRISQALANSLDLSRITGIRRTD